MKVDVAFQMNRPVRLSCRDYDPAALRHGTRRWLLKACVQSVLLVTGLRHTWSRQNRVGEKPALDAPRMAGSFNQDLPFLGPTRGTGRRCQG